MKPRYRPRLRLRFPVMLASGSQTGEGQILDFTIPGCLIESPMGVRQGQSLRLEMFLPGHTFPLSVQLAVVRWAKGKQFGVEFIKIHESQQRILRHFLDRHYAELVTSKASVPG